MDANCRIPYTGSAPPRGRPRRRALEDGYADIILRDCERLRGRVLEAVARYGAEAVLSESLLRGTRTLPTPRLVALAIAADMLRVIESAEPSPGFAASTGEPQEDMPLKAGLLAVLSACKRSYRGGVAGAGAAVSVDRVYAEDRSAFGFRCRDTEWAAALTCLRAAEASGAPSCLDGFAMLVRNIGRLIGRRTRPLPPALMAIFSHPMAHPDIRRLALEEAIVSENSAEVAALLERGLRIDIRLECGLSPLALAEGLGFRTIADALISAGARRCLQDEAVFLAACWEPSRLRRLLEAGASPHGGVATDCGRCSPLEAAATSRGDRWRSLVPGGPSTTGLAETIRVLLEAGASPDVVDAHGNRLFADEPAGLAILAAC